MSNRYNRQTEKRKRDKQTNKQTDTFLAYRNSDCRDFQAKFLWHVLADMAIIKTAVQKMRLFTRNVLLCLVEILYKMCIPSATIKQNPMLKTKMDKIHYRD